MLKKLTLIVGVALLLAGCGASGSATPGQANASARQATALSSGTISLATMLATLPATSGSPSLQDVACGGTFCMFVAGDYAIPWNDGVLGKPQLMLTDDQGQEIDGSTMVACSSATFCLDATSGNLNGRYAIWNGSGWVSKDVTNPTAAALGPAQIGPNYLTCPSDGTCFTILQDGSNNSVSVGSWSSDGWASTSLNDDNEVVTQVTCAQTNYCHIVGNAGGVWTYQNGSWTGPTTVSIADPQGSNDFPNRLDCVEGPFCITGGQNGGGVLIDRGSGFAAAHSLPDLYPPGGGGTLCVSASYCLVKQESYAASAPVQILQNGATLHAAPEGAAELFAYGTTATCLPNGACLAWKSGQDDIHVVALPNTQ